MQTNSVGIVVGAVVIVIFLCSVLLPVIESVSEDGGDEGETAGGMNTGSAGVPLAGYNDTALPDNPIDYDMTISLSDSFAGRRLDIQLTTPSQHTFRVPAVDQQVVLSNAFSIFVKDGGLIIRDADGYCSVDTLTLSATVSANDGIRATVEGQTYSSLTELYIPNMDGKYASYNTYQYENSEPIATGLWSYDTHIFGVQSHGLVMDSDSYGLTASYKDGFSGNGVIYRR